MQLTALGLMVTLCLSIPLVATPAPPTGKIYRIAHLVGRAVSPEEVVVLPTPMRAFWGELGQLGYVEGRNMVVEQWRIDGPPEHQAAVAAEVVHSHPDLILTFHSARAKVLQAATTTMPIVTTALDPLAQGLTTNVARPGGNITGVYVSTAPGLEAKRLQLLTEALPGRTRVAVLAPSQDPELASLLEAGGRLGLTVQHVVMDGPFDAAHYQAAFATMAQAQAQAVLVIHHHPHFANRERLVALAAQHKLPAMYAHRDYVEAGGLMAYGLSWRDLHRKMAGYVARILQGTTPGDLPFERGTTFEFVIHLKTAKALHLTIPPMVLFQADEIIK